MTDLPNPAADGAANVPTPDGETPAGDPELAALVQHDVPSDAGDPELAALVSPADAPAPDVLTDTTLVDTSPTSEAGVDAVPVLPLAAAVTDGEPRRGLAADGRSPSASASRSSLGFLLAIGIGAGVLYAWDQQYDGRVLPGVSVGSTNLGGLTREQAEAAIATAYASLGDGQISSPARTARRRPSATPTSAAAPTPRRCSTRPSRQAARASPSRTSSADPRSRSTA